VGFSVKSLLFLGFTGAASFSANMLLPEVEIEAFCASSLLLMADREGFSGLFALVPAIGKEGFSEDVKLSIFLDFLFIRQFGAIRSGRY